jgi:hypothetical protein
MPPLTLSASKGRRSSGAQIALPPDTLSRCVDAIYVPEDPEWPHKHPGRTSAGALPSGFTAANTYDIAHAGFSTTDKVLVLGNSKIVRATGGATLGAFADLEDLDSADFARTGTYLRAIPDGWRRAVLFTGAASERPLVLDEDNNVRFLSLKKPSDTGTLAATATTPTIARPDSPEGTPATCSEGTVTANFSNTANARDGDASTYASGYLTAPGIIASDWEFTDAGNTPSAQKLNVRFATSSLPPGDVELPADRRTTESVSAYVVVQISVDNGAAFTTVFNNNVPVGDTTIQFDVGSGVAWASIIVRVIFRYVSGTIKAGALVYDIWSQEATAGGSVIIAAGTYGYAVVEVFTVTLASGRTIVVYSAPSKIVYVTLNGTTHVGVTLTLPARANLNSDGVGSSGTTKLLKRYIYRTVTNGVYPDLGYIGEATIAATTFVDAFTVAADTLGSPGLPVQYVGDTVYPLHSQAPALLDACLHDGSIVYIDKDNPYGFGWTPRGFPESFPVPQHTGNLPTFRNDQAKGVESLGNSVIIFQRSQVMRARGLPMASEPNFNIGNLEITTLSANYGLAGSPRSKTTIQSQRGHAMVVWVSDDGIYGTDGSLPSERGMGCIKISVRFDWNLVDGARLAETHLTFDPVLQLLAFDYYDRAGTLQTEYFHTFPEAWVPSGQDQLVPICSGPHSFTAVGRTVGENGGVLRHWSLSTADLVVYSERTGTGRANAAFTTHIEWGWQYPAGPRSEVQFYGGSIAHTDWGASETLDVELLTRDDETGIIQPSKKAGVSLRGARVSELGDLPGAGQAFTIILRHHGKTTSAGTPVRAFGPVTLEAELVDEVRS